MIVLWLLLYVVGFAVTTLVMKYFKVGTKNVDDASWWAAIVIWPLFVPAALLIKAVTEGLVTILSWWDEVSDEIVEKLREKSQNEFPLQKPVGYDERKAVRTGDD